MRMPYVLSDYIELAMQQAEYDKLDDGTFAGRVPGCQGVIAFGPSLRACEDQLRATLEDWILVGLKLGHALPVMGALNLNLMPSHEPLGAV